MFVEDTIAAVATAYGEGGIGIIRISGNEAGKLLGKVFVAENKKELKSRSMVYGYIVDSESEEQIDEVLVCFMPSPHTYTREDVAEIHCHGSVVSLRRTLGLVLRLGARLAEPGEFTKRAFLNGRIDLAQAEAVIDLIKAKTEKSFDSALGQMEGKLSLSVREIRKTLMALLVNITVNLDYPDEDIEELTYTQLTNSISQVNDMIEALLAKSETGRVIREGLRVVIAGSPNVGKSSLMNSLLREGRAIVTEIPGTTRDIIEETLSLRGIPVKLVDTAGIRSTDDRIEKIGIEKSKEAFINSDLILFMVDGSTPLTPGDLELLREIEGKAAFVLINKIDMEQRICEAQIQAICPNREIISISAINDIGISQLEEKIEELVYGGEIKQASSLLVTNVRHKNLLLLARDALSDALSMAEKREALDFIEVDVKSAWQFLGEIIGETASEDIINEVFANFCLGK